MEREVILMANENVASYEEQSNFNNYHQKGKLDEHGNLLIYWVEDFDGDYDGVLGDMDEGNGEF